MMKLPAGKLDSELLKKTVFDKITYRDESVKIRPGIGEDCAVVDFGQWDCVMSTDPITSSVKEIGRLCIHITCNDIASNGVKPVGIMLAVMLPVGTTIEDVEHIMDQAARTAAELSVEIIGGHTEITPAVKQPVIVSTAIGKALSGSSQSGKAMVPGDYILVSKSCGLEGAAIAAGDHEDELISIRDEEGRSVFTEEEIEQAKSFVDMVSVVREGVAAESVGTHGMHDITEGGLLGAVWEMCQIAKVGAEIEEDAVPIEDVTRKICDCFGIDPLRLISSGSMLIITGEDKIDEMIAVMKDEGIPVTVIGRVKESSEGISLVRRVPTCGTGQPGRIKTAIDPPGADEIYRIVERSI